MLQEVLESGAGGDDAKDAMSLRAVDSLNPGVANAHAMEGSFKTGYNILGLVWSELEICVMEELECAVIHGCHRG